LTDTDNAAVQETQFDEQSGNKTIKFVDSNHIIIVDEQSPEKSVEVCKSENIENRQVLENNSELNETNETSDKTLSNMSMPRNHPRDSFSSEDEILKKLEAAKKLSQNEAEINAAIRSLKTNLILCLTLIFIFILLPALNPTFGIIIVSLMKGFIPILTTISNFGKIQTLIRSNLSNLAKKLEELVIKYAFF
jgi:hypothetical protein